MTTVKRLITTMAAALALAAVPGAATAQPVNQCVDPDPNSSGMYVCVSVDPATASVEVMVTTTNAKHVLFVGPDGVSLCVHTGSSHDCILGGDV